jgi:hypothetical protein
VRNVRTWPAMAREKAQAAPTARPKVPMRRLGADCFVLARKAGVMPVERRGQVTDVGSEPTGNRRSSILNGRRQPSCGGTSRMTRECQVRICERLGVKFPGPTRQTRSWRRCPLHGRSSTESGRHMQRSKQLVHSTIASATASSLSGTVRPSILAVLPLMTSSNLDACATGKSAGLTPLRMRPL